MSFLSCDFPFLCDDQSRSCAGLLQRMSCVLGLVAVPTAARSEHGHAKLWRVHNSPVGKALRVRGPIMGEKLSAR